MNEESSDYCVIKFDHPPKKSLDKYLCVPKSWTRPSEYESGINLDQTLILRWVRVWYPLEPARITSVRVDNREEPDPIRWGMYMATVEYRGNYDGAMGWINCMRWLKKNVNTDLLNALLKQNTAGEASAEDHQQNHSSIDQQLPSIPQISPDASHFAVKSEPVYSTECRVKVEHSESEEISSSSPNNQNKHANHRGIIAACLPPAIQSILKEVNKMMQGQYRFEFDEIRYIRECDNVIIDRETNLTINMNDDDVTDTEDIAAGNNQEAILSTDRIYTTQAQEVSPSLPLPGAGGVSQSSPLHRSFSSTHTVTTSKYVTPSSALSSRIKRSYKKAWAPSEESASPNNCHSNGPPSLEHYSRIPDNLLEMLKCKNWSISESNPTLGHSSAADIQARVSNPQNHVVNRPQPQSSVDNINGDKTMKSKTSKISVSPADNSFSKHKQPERVEQRSRDTPSSRELCNQPCARKRENYSKLRVTLGNKDDHPKKVRPNIITIEVE